MAKKDEIDAEADEYMRHAKETLGVPMWGAVASATLITLVFYALLWVLYDKGTSPYMIRLFTDRGMIPYITTFGFCVGIVFLHLKSPMIRKEMRGFSILNSKVGELKASPINEEIAKAIDKKIETFAPEQRNLVVVRRVRTAIKRYIQGGYTSEVGDVLGTMSDIDRDIVESSYTSLRFLVGILPVLGFIGTVLGISAALSEFGGIIPSAGEMTLSEIISDLGGVTKNLGIAFDTTLLALVLAGILMLRMSIVQKREENFLSATDDFCVSDLVNRMVGTTPHEPDAIKDGIGEISSKLSSMNEAISKLLDVLPDAGEAQKENLNKMAEIFQKFPDQFDKSASRSEESTKELVNALKENLDSIEEKFNKLFAETSELFGQGEAVKNVAEGLSSVTDLHTVMGENKQLLQDLQEELKLQNENSVSLQDLLKALGSQQTEIQGVLRDLHPPIKKLAEDGVGVKILT